MKSILKLVLVTMFICTLSTVFGQTNEKASSSVESKEGNLEEVQIFKDYEWLEDLISPKDCEGIKITVKSSSERSTIKYVVVNDNGTIKMYDSKGTVYCADHSSLSCEEFYKLEVEHDSWMCSKS